MNVGIFGTFFGICIALLHFDATDIDASVPGLLSGMKLAFATSVLGVGLSILLHFFDSARKDDKADAEASPVEALIGEMQTSRKAIVEELARVVKNGNEAARQQAEQNAHTVEALEKLHKSLVGDDDASLATRLLHMRQDASDGRKKLEQILTGSFGEIREEFSKFGKTLAESNSKALLEALREVIRDFNSQLNEQFGENFKELNRAVGDLLTWQEHYKDSVAQMQTQFQRCLDGVACCEESLNSIRNHAETIPQTMETLSGILQGLEQQNKQANALLESFAHMRQQAGEALPVIKKELAAITEGLSKSVQETGQKVAAFTVEATESMKSAVATQNKAVAELTFHQTEAMREVTEKHAQDLESATKAIGAELRTLTQKLSQDISETGQNLTAFAVTATENMKTAVEEQHKAVSELTSHQTEALKQASNKHAQDLNATTQVMADQLNGMVTKIGSGLTSSVTQTVKGINGATEMITSTVTGVSDSLKTSTKLFGDTLSESVERTTDDLANTSKKAQEAVEQSGRKALEVLDQNARNLQNSIDDALQKTRELMNSQFKAFDATMEKELEKAISQLGSHLTSLSGKFVEDYTPLTNRLAEIVRISEKAGSDGRGGPGSGRH